MYIEIFGTNVNWVAQLLDLIGFAFILVAYQQKKEKLLLISMIAYAMFTAEAVVLLIGGENTVANIIISFVSIVRNVLMIIVMRKYNKELPTWVAIVLLVITAGANIPFFKEWFSYLPIIFFSIYTISAIQKNFYILKVGAALLEGSFVVYNFVTGAYFGAVREAILVVSIIVSIILMIQKDKKAKNEIAPALEESITPAQSSVDE